MPYGADLIEVHKLLPSRGLGTRNSTRVDAWSLTKKSDLIESKNDRTARGFLHKTTMFPANLVHCGTFPSYLFSDSVPL
jgi:hypothetical protein